MKVALILLHTQYYRHFDKAVRLLAGEGHHADVVVEWIEKPNLTDRVLESARAEVANLQFHKPIQRRDVWTYLIHPLRELVNYAVYFRPDHPSKKLAVRWQKYFSPVIWKILQTPWMIKFLTMSPVQSLLGGVEKVVPPGGNIIRWLDEHRPDIIVASPLITARSPEVEYIKAGRALNIPTVYALASWDNLTTKGTLHVLPDLVFVWNQAILEEAVTLHGVPSENIVVTGSPTFDYWFEVRPSCSRSEFCKAAGFDPARQYVVYLCSSRGMMEDETDFIQELAAEMRNSPATKDLVLLVRPHPYNTLNLGTLVHDNICVYPEQGNLPDVDDAKQAYFDTLFYAAATVGVNTSAMLESAIADKPCITIVDDRYRRSQTEMGHFRHLINGDFLQVNYSYADAANSIEGILKGDDPKKENRRRFVRDFIRPHGMDRSVSRIFATALEMAAQRKTAAEITKSIEGGGA